MKKILLLGHTGKVGSALYEELSTNYDVIGKNSKDFDAKFFRETHNLIKEYEPDIVINTVALIGINECETEPILAFQLNSLYPKYLSQLSNVFNFLLIHFSTDCVYGNQGVCSEVNEPQPINIYGYTKAMGDYFIEKEGIKYYIFRLPLVFGKHPKNNQFIEQTYFNNEKKLRIANDVYTTPTYNKDIATKIKNILEENLTHGLYHISNNGVATLYEVVCELISNKKEITPTLHTEFKNLGEKNINSGLISYKITPMRHWREAMREYKNEIITI